MEFPALGAAVPPRSSLLGFLSPLPTSTELLFQTSSEVVVGATIVRPTVCLCRRPLPPQIGHIRCPPVLGQTVEFLPTLASVAFSAIHEMLPPSST